MLVRADAKGGVRVVEPTARRAQLIAFQVHPCECEQRRGIRVLDRSQRPVGREGLFGLTSQLDGTAQPAAQGLYQREISEAIGSFVPGAGIGSGARTRNEDTGRRTETARP